MSPAANHFDVIILGAGAAGMMCAFEAGRRGHRVLLLEHSERPGRKILISGGGRCNFTNIHTRAENFLSANPHFAKSALARFTPADMVALVERHGIPYHEKTLGQLFCDDTAVRIVNLLQTECEEARVILRSGAEVVSVINLSADNARFRVDTRTGSFTAQSVVVATGGLSIPKMGATGIGYDIARSFGHTLIEPRAGLVPLVFVPADRDNWCDLTGLSTEAIASAPTTAKQRGRTPPAPFFREKLLITHRGLSGPAALQISSYWRPGKPLTFDIAPGLEVFAPLLSSSAGRDDFSLLQTLSTVLPARFAKRWLMTRSEIDYTNAGLARLEVELHNWQITPAGTEGFEKAEVTTGGVDTAELDARTMESRRTPGLYFIGEVVDVTGWLGGYNFQWAWASAVAAGRSV
ncbi:MAG TPA: NAD(P)/FAD-dependent oxidoreductase [Acidobacteriaceae bacterium]|nr:NAD(P)/FAD-dependent oxidoreductase [Acidobacteriaceae bacterium]